MHGSTHFALLGLFGLMACGGPSGDAPLDGALGADADMQDQESDQGRSDAADMRLAPLEGGELRPGGETTVDVAGEGAFVQRASNLALTRRNAFAAGLELFRLRWVPAPGRADVDGLGPVFNAERCIDCHGANGRGSRDTILVRIGSASGEPDPVYGHQIQPFGTNGVPGEGSPQFDEELRTVAGSSLFYPLYRIETLAFGPLSSDARLSPRVAQQLVGLGLLESIDEASLRQRHDPDDDDGDGITGRLAELDGAIGRFGWKAAQPTVEAQTASAFLGDMGLTSPLFPNENCTSPQVACSLAPDGGAPEVSAIRLAQTASYLRLLGVPARRNGDAADVRRGKAVFMDIGCERCHRATYETGVAEEPELSAQRIWPYTDLLLHDMGEGLADGLAEGDASGSEWRTPPLWSLALVREVNGTLRLLHDGRAENWDEAIRWHDGEGSEAREAYTALSEEESDALHAFLESL